MMRNLHEGNGLGRHPESLIGDQPIPDALLVVGIAGVGAEPDVPSDRDRVYIRQVKVRRVQAGASRLMRRSSWRALAAAEPLLFEKGQQEPVHDQRRSRIVG